MKKKKEKEISTSLEETLTRKGRNGFTSDGNIVDEYRYALIFLDIESSHMKTKISRNIKFVFFVLI